MAVEYGGPQKPCKCRWQKSCRHGDVCHTPKTNEEAKPLCYMSIKKPFKLTSTRGRAKK
jgi:hypothetical protein